MLPRKSLVIKYIFILSILALLLLLWNTGGKHNINCRSAHRQLSTVFEDEFTYNVSSLNASLLEEEFLRLVKEVNKTTGLDRVYLKDAVSKRRRSPRELYRMVRSLRGRLPVASDHFSFTINPGTSVCGSLFKKPVFLLIYIHSAPAHHKRRTAIRTTWGSVLNFSPDSVKLVFLLGKPQDAYVQSALEMESNRYGDIVQQDFVDSYRNLTYKAAMGLKWASVFCPHAKYVLKSDDDIFVNVYNLIGHLKSLLYHEGPHRRWILCLVWNRMKVVRDKRSKWYIPTDEYKEDYFPTYCSGSAFVMSSDLVTEMYSLYRKVPFFWVDDFYITGMLAAKANATWQNFRSVYVLGPSTFLEKFTEKYKWQTLVFGHVHNLDAMTKVWSNVKKFHGVISNDLLLLHKKGSRQL